MNLVNCAAIKTYKQYYSLNYTLLDSIFLFACNINIPLTVSISTIPKKEEE